jgi:DNA-binding FrmR family transcriptional regulator
MSHLIHEKKKMIARVRRIRGQLEAVERSLENDANCEDTLQLIASARGAMNGLMAEVLEGHIREHVAGDIEDPQSEQALAVDQLVDIIRAYLR